jgi:hypothetical protein
LSGFKSFDFVLFEPVRSAEPPTVSGIAALMTSSAFCDELRVASAGGDFASS